jgi:N-acylneuraminate cytidylyltransferase/CMP-N,N'-diacetyllegionaminic acid synthase
MGAIVAVVHARGGSVRVPLKNIRPLAGTPLVVWTIEAALASRCDRVIVSTDHDDIAQIARSVGAEVPFRRPVDISEDVASELVTQHAIAFHERETGKRVDLALTIQPTTPFLKGTDIDACIEMLQRNPDLKSVFTAGPIHERPEWMFLRDDRGRATKFLDGVLHGDAGISQTLPPLWIPNGGAYATRREVLFDEGIIIADPCGIHPMSEWASVDIDTEADFVYAEMIAQKFGWVKTRHPSLSTKSDSQRNVE